jgi:hypothetical protein
MPRNNLTITATLLLLPAFLGEPVSALAKSPQEQLSETYRAEEVELQGVVGRVEISTHDGSQIRVIASGARSRTKRLRITMRGPILFIEDKGVGTRIRNSVHVEHNVVIASEGGSSTQIIGGAPGLLQPTDRLRLHLAVPRKTALSINDFVGDLVAGDVMGQFRLSVQAGTARLGRMRAVQLAINGGADITAERVDGSLDITLTGSGAATIRDGSISRLSIASAGSAMVHVGGTVRRATISAVGVADVHVAHVEQRPTVETNGAASVTFGNW